MAYLSIPFAGVLDGMYVWSIVNGSRINNQTIDEAVRARLDGEDCCCKHRLGYSLCAKYFVVPYVVEPAGGRLANNIHRNRSAVAMVQLLEIEFQGSIPQRHKEGLADLLAGLESSLCRRIRQLFDSCTNYSIISQPLVSIPGGHDCVVAVRQGGRGSE